MRRRLWLGLSTIVLFLVVGLVCWFLLVRDSGPIPRTYKSGLDFTLYYPTHLPSGYSVDRTSFKREADVLIFSIKAPGGRNIAVSEQAIPSDEAATHRAKSAPISLPGEKTFTTGIGNVHIGLWADKYVGDIITDDTWIILNVSGFTSNEAAAISQSFRKL